MARFRPLSDRIAVRPDPADETTGGGLVIPDSARDRPQRGTVIAVGPGRVENGAHVEMSVQEGDHVLYGRHAGTEIHLDGEDVLVLSESDLFGCLDDE